MNSSGSIQYARRDGLVVLKLIGSIRALGRDACRLSAALEQFLRGLFDHKDFQNVMVDLNETTSIDSTNLGLLAQIAQFTRSQWQRRPILLSTNEDINAILESVGFDQVFVILHERRPAEGDLESLPALAEPELDQLRLMLRAHRSLLDLNQSNEAQFRNVVEALETEAVRQSTLRPDHVTT